MGMGDVSDSLACSWDPFFPTGLPRPALIGGFVPSLIVTCCALFVGNARDVCSFQNGSRGVDLGERGGWEDLGGEEEGKL